MTRLCKTLTCTQGQLKTKIHNDNEQCKVNNTKKTGRKATFHVHTKKSQINALKVFQCTYLHILLVHSVYGKISMTFPSSRIDNSNLGKVIFSDISMAFSNVGQMKFRDIFVKFSYVGKIKFI